MNKKGEQKMDFGIARKKLELIVIIFILFFSTNIAMSLTNDLVIDEVGIFGGEAESIRSVIKSLGNGIEARVIAVKSMKGAANLDQYSQNIIKELPALGNAKGNDYKSNIVIILIAMDESKVGVYYGSEWAKALKGQTSRIISDHMGSNLKLGKNATGLERNKYFAKAVISGINEASRLIDAQLHPSTNTAPVVVVRESVKQPTDFSGLWKVLGGSVVLIALFGGVYLFMQSSKRKREEEEERKNAQQSAKIAKSAAVEAINKTEEQLGSLEKEVVVISGYIDDDKKTELSDYIKSLRQIMAIAAQKFSGVEGTAGDAEANDLTTAQYQAINNVLKEVNHDLATTSQGANSCLAEIRNIKSEIMDLPKQVEAMIAKRNKVFTAVKEQTGKTFKGIEFNEAFGVADELLANTKASSTKPKEIRANLKQCDELLNAIEEQLQEQIKKIKNSEKLFSDAKTASIETSNVIDSAKTAIPDSSELNLALFTEKKGLLTTAKSECDKPNAAIENGKALLDQQKWLEAAAQFEVALKEFKRITKAVNEIREYFEDLQKIKKDLPRLIDKQFNSITSLTEYINSNRGDIADADELISKINQLPRQLNAVRAELSVASIDPFEINKKVDGIKERLNQLKDAASSKVEEAERKRREAAEASQRARRKLEETRHYLDRNSSRVSGSRRYYGEIDDLERRLSDAERNNDTMQMLVLLNAIESSHTHVHETIVHEVDSYEPPRHHHHNGYTRNEDDGPSGGGSSFSFDSGSDDSGGGSSFSFDSGSSDCGGGSSDDF